MGVRRLSPRTFTVFLVGMSVDSANTQCLWCRVCVDPQGRGVGPGPCADGETRCVCECVRPVCRDTAHPHGSPRGHTHDTHTDTRGSIIHMCGMWVDEGFAAWFADVRENGTHKGRSPIVTPQASM